jgi:hypothetical protein
MQEGLVYGTLDQEFLPRLAAEYLLLQMHYQEQFKCDISTDYVPLIAPIHSNCSSGGVNFCNQYENVLITPYFFVINWLFFL